MPRPTLPLCKLYRRPKCILTLSIAAQVDWNPSKDMPNSSGCVHAHPSDVEQIYHLLLAQGVVVRENPFSGKNYPYKPQGIAVVELVA